MILCQTYEVSHGNAEGKEIILVGDTYCDYKKPNDCNPRKLKLNKC